MSVLQESDIMRKMQTNRMSAQDVHNAVINTGDYVIIADPAVGARGQLAGAKKETGGAWTGFGYVTCRTSAVFPASRWWQQVCDLRKAT